LTNWIFLSVACIISFLLCTKFKIQSCYIIVVFKRCPNCQLGLLLFMCQLGRFICICMWWLKSFYQMRRWKSFCQMGRLILLCKMNAISGSWSSCISCICVNIESCVSPSKRKVKKKTLSLCLFLLVYFWVMNILN